MGRRTILGLVLFASILAACGSDDDGASSEGTNSTRPEEVATDLPDPLPERVSMTIALNGALIGQQLPYFVAIDKGYFEQVGFDVEVVDYTTSSDTLIAQASTGDIDVIPLTPGPALFNQAAEGFGITVLGSGPVGRDGRFQLGWFVVREDLADEIQSTEDLRGRTIDASGPGSPPDLVVRATLAEAGLVPDEDVRVTYLARGPADYLPLFQNQVVDVIPTAEPLASQLEAQGLGVKWRAFHELVPYYRTGFLGASADFASNAEAVQKFLEVWLFTVREINSTDGEWTPELLEIARGWSGMTDEVISAPGGVPYFDPLGELPPEDLERLQQFWVDAGQVSRPADIDDLIDAAPREAAAAALGLDP